MSQSSAYSLANSVASKVALSLAKARKTHEPHDARQARKAHNAQIKGTMKWLPFQSSFVLEKICELIRTGICTDKGFKEVHLTAVYKALFEHCGAYVTSTMVYNHLHLRKWRTRWIHISKLRDLSGAQWDDLMILLFAWMILLSLSFASGYVLISVVYVQC
jgi:hypothetical protein